MNDSNYTIENLGNDLFKNLWSDKTQEEVYRQLAFVFADNEAHALRLYQYFINKLFLPSSPIIACVPFQNEKLKGLPISCFLSETNESGLYSLINETSYIAKHSGGLGTCWSKTPSIYANNNGGTISQINIQGKIMKYCGGIARKVGSMCAWLNIEHADIEQFIDMRMNKSGVDVDLQTPRYIHHGVILTDNFMKAVKNNEMINLQDYDGTFVKQVSARELFDKIIVVRTQTGEPLIFFEGNANKVLSEHHKKLNLTIKTTNLCTEIVLPTGIDHKNIRRTAVCCLSSINLEKRDEWLYNVNFMEDIARFMDNVLTYFNIMSVKYHVDDIVTENCHYFATKYRDQEYDYVLKAFQINHALKSAIYSAYCSRDVGIGVVGLQGLFQSKGIAVENKGKLTPAAKQLNIEIFRDIYTKFNIINEKLGKERGACQDIIDANVNYIKRFSYMLAIAPTTVIAALMNTTPGIQFDPAIYVYKNQTVSVSLYNKYLQTLLIERDMNNINVWRRINNGEYEGILSEEEYEIYKGSFDINQLNILEMAADRAAFIDQAQSINLAINRNILSANKLREMLLYAYNNGVKTLYYSFNQTADKIEDNLNKSLEMSSSEPETCAFNIDCAACVS